MRKIDLTQVKAGQSGIVTEIQGGYGLIRRIQSLGVREGKRITKVSSHFWRGPQTIKVDNLRVAIGFGMAKRIIVEMER